MQTVESIIESVYGKAQDAAQRLGVERTSISNWKAAGKFPARLAAAICQHARESGIGLDIADIPLTDAINRPIAAARAETTQ